MLSSVETITEMVQNVTIQIQGWVFDASHPVVVVSMKIVIPV